MGFVSQSSRVRLSLLLVHFFLPHLFLLFASLLLCLDTELCEQPANASLMVWGCMSACGMGSLHIWKGTINAERYIQVLEQHMLQSRRRLFQGRPCIFQHDNARPHTASITTSWLRRRRIRVLKWPACSPDLSPIENIWRIIKRKMRQRRPKTVEQLEACIRQEWDNIPIPKLEQLVSSVPRRLQTVIKRRGDATQW